jgi:hypothetical protein
VAGVIEVPVYRRVTAGGDRLTRPVGTVSYSEAEPRVAASQYIGAAGRGISLPSAFTLTVTEMAVPVAIHFAVVDGRVRIAGGEWSGGGGGGTLTTIMNRLYAWEIAAIRAVLEPYLTVSSAVDADGKPTTDYASAAFMTLKPGPAKGSLNEELDDYDVAAGMLHSQAQSPIGRPTVRTPRWWQESVVRPYLDALDDGGSKAAAYAAVEEAAGVADSTAKNLVSEARKAGLIQEGK